LTVAARLMRASMVVEPVKVKLLEEDEVALPDA
jgi:hypothetical protein